VGTLTRRVRIRHPRRHRHQEVENVQPMISSDSIREVWKVSEWKWNIDKGSPWWRQVFFHYVFLPFLNFSFGTMKVPAPKEVTVEADEHGRIKRTYSWFEDIAILPDEDMADNACLTEHHGYKRMVYGRVAPSESAQYSGTIFPRKNKHSHKWANPALSLVIKDRKQDELKDQTLALALTKLNQVLDRR
jgi:hypothetical protein